VKSILPLGRRAVNERDATKLMGNDGTSEDYVHI
jgi:hypothetical protein